MARRPRKQQHRPSRKGFSVRNVALGLGAFVVGTAALAVGAVAFATRRPEGPEEERADPAGAGRPLVSTAAAQAAASVPSDGAGNSPQVGGLAPSRAQVGGAGEAIAGEGHAAPDLAAAAPDGVRASAAFRPDVDAPMSDAEREALRPAPGPSPTLVDAGTSVPAGS